MFDRSAAVKLQLRDKKGKWIKMGSHVKWHSLEEDSDVTGIARGESGNNIIVEFSHAGQTYHINVPANKVEVINEKASLSPTYVQHMGGHTNTPNIADHGVTAYHTVTHYGVASKDPGTPLTTKISDLKPGDVVYPIKNHDEKTPASIQKSPYNVKDPTTKAQMQKFATSGHGVVKKIAYDENGNAKYAVITDKKGKDHFPSAQHYAVKQHDTLDKAILDAHADESQAMGHTTKSGLVDDVKGTHTTQDKFDASKASVGTTVQIPKTSHTFVTVTKTAEGEWKEEGKAHGLSDGQVSTLINNANGHFTPLTSEITEEPLDPHKLIGPKYAEAIAKQKAESAQNPFGDNFAKINGLANYKKGDVVVLKDGNIGQWIGKGQLTLEDGSKVPGNKFSVDGKESVIAGKDIAATYRPKEFVVHTAGTNPFGEGTHGYSFDLSKPNNENFKSGDLVVYGNENNHGKIISVNPTTILVEKLNSDKTVHGTPTIVAGQVHGLYRIDASATSAEPSAPEHVVNAEAPIDISGWTKKPGTQMGSNAGGIYTDKNGNDWYVKLSQSDDHARSEVLADDLYKAAGVQTSNLKLADVGGGKLGTASQMMPGVKQDLSSHLNDPEYMAKIQDGFAMDALLANWDVAGLGYDNIVTDAHGNPVRVDPGGALLFRAQGQPKGDAFGNKVGEWESLRGQGSQSNTQATALFGKMTDQQLADSAKHVEALTPEKINSIVDSIGFDNKTATELKDKLAARREDIIAHAAKLSPGPATDHAPSAPAAVPNAPQEPAAPAPDNHPDFNATYPDKGKDQIDANGNTIKVNDLISHPKKGVGKVFIGLPSTNSVKVVYPDGSKATHLSKAVTKVEGDVPKVEALPSDLKVGDHGIDPATHTAFIVGNNNSLIHVGDTVTHSNGDKGVVKGIYKGEKTVKVEWADGHTSGPKKASTLESENKHVPTEPNAPQHEAAPAPQEPAPIPEPVHEEPPAPAPSVAPDVNAIASKKPADLTEEELSNLPIGTVIKKAPGSQYYQEKVDENQWKLKSYSPSQFTFGPAKSDTYMLGVLKDSGLYESIKLPEHATVSAPSEDGHSGEPSAATPSEDLSTKNPSDLTYDDLNALPIGTEIHKGPEASYFQKKVGDGQWQTFKTSTNKPAFSHKNSNDHVINAVHNGLYQSIKLPENTPEETAPAAPEVPHDVSTPAMLQDPSTNDLSKLPDGTILKDSNMPGYSFEKNGGAWIQHSPSGNSVDISDHHLADGSNYSVQLPEGHTAETAPSGDGFKPMSTQELKDFPTGTKITTNHVVEGGYSKPYWVKQSDGSYKEYDELTGHEETGHSYTPFLMSDGFPMKAELPPKEGTESTSELSQFLNEPLSKIMDTVHFVNLPIGSEIGMPHSNNAFKKAAENAWHKVDKASGEQTSNNVIGDDNFINLSDTSLSSFHVLKIGDGPTAQPSSLTGVTTGQSLSKGLLDAQPVGTSMKKESAYGTSAFYYVKQSDGTWKLFKNGKETNDAPYTSDSINANATATFGVPTPGSKFFYSKTGEITYEGDKVTYKGEAGHISSITNTGLISVKLDSESKAKYKSASTLVKTPTYGKKDAAAFEPASTPNLTTTSSEDNHTGGSATHNFAGASGAAYDQQGLAMPSTTSDSHLSNGLTLTPSHKADPSNPLYGTPEPTAPVAPASYPAFHAEEISPLPKWDSAKWLEAVKARYDANPHKAKATLEESANWSKIQTVLNGEEIHLDSLVNSKYLDETLKKEAIDGIVSQEFKNKPLIEAHNAKVAEAKKQYDAAKAQHLADYAAQKQEYTQKFDDWVAANPNQHAVEPIQLPETSKESFSGGTADWSKAHAGTFSAQTVFDSIKKDNQLGTKGLSIATDSDQVEALDANVMKILNTSGKPVIQVKMKLTGPYGAAFEKVLKGQPGVTKTSGIFSNYLVHDDSSGLLKDHGQPSDTSWVHGGDRYSWTDPSTGAEVDFQRSSEQGINVSANNNTVRIHMPENATPEDYQKVLENMGINAKPSSEGDIRVLAENQLLAMMGKSTSDTKIYDGNVNFSGASRASQLQEIKDKYGVTPDDMLFSSEANGRVRFFLKDDKAQALADKYGVQSFGHKASGLDTSTWLNILVGPNNGLLSTYHRWNEGIGGEGMSSKSDHAYGSSDYVYLTPKSSLPTSNTEAAVVINPKAIFRRTDWWANHSDDFGMKNHGTSTSPYNTFDKATGGSPYNGGIHEVLPKDSVPVSDWMYVNMGSAMRQEVIKGLKDRGVLKINGVPVEDFIRTPHLLSEAPITPIPTVE